MATKKKPGEEFTGRNGNKVTYYLNGKLVERLIGINTNPPTVNQYSCRQATTLISALLKPVKEYLSVGYEFEGRAAKMLPYHLAASYNYHNAISGEYPEQWIDFKKVLFSKGSMPLTDEVEAELISSGIKFTWSSLPSLHGHKLTDIAMLMAYESSRKEAFFTMGGPVRSSGSASMSLKNIKRKLVLETYICFMSANRKSISNSQYTGQLIWMS